MGFFDPKVGDTLPCSLASLQAVNFPEFPPPPQTKRKTGPVKLLPSKDDDLQARHLPLRHRGLISSRAEGSVRGAGGSQVSGGG